MSKPKRCFQAVATIALVILTVFSGRTKLSLPGELPASAQAAPVAGETAPSLWVTPLDLNFGPVIVGETSGPLRVTITNSGNEILGSFAGGGVAAPFTGSQTCAGGVAPSASCQYTFYFIPESTGIFTATSSSSTDAGPIKIFLRGEGIPSAGVGTSLHVTPLVLDFGPVLIGESSAPQVVTVRNTGTELLENFAGGGVGLPFTATQNCASGIPPGGSCQFIYSFRPTQAGKFTTRSNVSTNAGPFSILLIGGAELPVFSQSFLPIQIMPGEVSTLSFTVKNPNPGATFFDVAFDNTLPPGLQIAAPLTFTTSPECGSPSFAPVAGDVTIRFSEGTIMGGKTCTIQVNVTANSTGTFTNIAEPITTSSGPGASSQAQIQVGALLYLPAVQVKP